VFCKIGGNTRSTGESHSWCRFLTLRGLGVCPRQPGDNTPSRTHPRSFAAGRRIQLRRRFTLGIQPDLTNPSLPTTMQSSQSTWETKPKTTANMAILGIRWNGFRWENLKYSPRHWLRNGGNRCMSPGSIRLGYPQSQAQRTPTRQLHTCCSYQASKKDEPVPALE
jgi:hypothetical protein